MSTALPDRPDRAAAAGDFAASVVVEAGAGTGKTALLVERLLTAVGSGTVGVRDIAAITFTEKAAGEMKKRFAEGLERLAALARGAATPEPDEKDAADRALRRLTLERGVPLDHAGRYALAALASLDRATITTIHSLCAEILRSHPREAGVDPSFEVDRGERFDSLFATEWERFAAEEWGPRATQTGPWSDLLERIPESKLREIARGLSGFLVPAELLSGPRSAPDPRALLRAECEAILARATEVEAGERVWTPATLEYFAAVRRLLGAFLDRGPEAVRDLLAGDDALSSRIRNGASAGKKPSEESARALKEFVATSRGFVMELEHLDEELAGNVLDVLAPFALGFRETLLRRGLVSFDGLLSLVRDLLRDHPHVREALKRRFRMILVDEFQDTDPVQYEIVLYLGERPGGSATDPFRAELSPGRLFIVGDPKQSIYRFRGADYGAFRRAVLRILDQGACVRTLSANFRSAAPILDAVNVLFRAGSGGWIESPYQPRYVPIDATRVPESAARCVEIWTTESSGAAGSENRGDGAARPLRAEERRLREGTVIARQIRKWVEEERACDYGDITVLFRAFSSLHLYLRGFRGEGIPFVVDGGRNFVDRPEVGHLLAALRALVLPSDPAALLAFLRSPLGGVSDVELAEYAAGGPAWSWKRLADRARFPGIARAFDLLRSLAEETRDLPPDVLVRHVVRRTGLLPLSAVSFEGAQRVANVRKLVRLAAELCRDGTLSVREILEALEEERVAELDADSPLADEGNHAVRVMTIHKAKGLENRRVIVADFAGEQHRSDARDPVRVARLPEGPAIALGIGKKRSAARVRLDRDEARHSAAEETRVLYVALTRARDVLAVVAGPARGEARWLDALRAWGYDAQRPPPNGAVLLDGRIVHRSFEVPVAVAAVPTGTGSDATEVGPAVTAYEGAVGLLRRTARPLLSQPSTHEEAGRASDAARRRRRLRAGSLPWTARWRERRAPCSTPCSGASTGPRTSPLRVYSRRCRARRRPRQAPIHRRSRARRDLSRMRSSTRLSPRGGARSASSDARCRCCSAATGRPGSDPWTSSIRTPTDRWSSPTSRPIERTTRQRSPLGTAGRSPCTSRPRCAPCICPPLPARSSG